MKVVEDAPGGKRRYQMAARATATAATRSAIAEAFAASLLDLHYEEITLDLVATRADVTVQTVIRHFGSKEELFATVAREQGAQEAARRAEAVPGDIPGAVRIVVAHYERIGDVVLRLLAQEDRFAAIREVTDAGRQIHYDWVERAFAPFLQPMSRAARRRRQGQLVVLTDLFVWRHLRRDLHLSRGQTELAMTEPVEALLTGGK